MWKEGERGLPIYSVLVQNSRKYKEFEMIIESIGNTFILKNSPTNFIVSNI